MERSQSNAMITPIEWKGDTLRILDQTRLPHQIEYINTDDYRVVIEAITSLRVRGAPAIGIAAAYGIALAAIGIHMEQVAEFKRKLESVLQEFAASRPTAVNLFKAIDRMRNAIIACSTTASMKQVLEEEAKKIHEEEKESTRLISKYGAELIQDGFTVLTHCNAGPLATGGYGTALGIIIAAADQGKRIEVISCETRPLLQGARLTTWELLQHKIPVELIIDSAAGYYLHSKKVDCVIIGADRIAANGDTANKIGSYTHAVTAYENKIPFYVAAPVSTIDLTIKSGDEITIEERSPVEVTDIGGVRFAPDKVNALNPAFDVTPARYISAIITEKGIIQKPFRKNLKK
jgi:methylthioribose-1-phosphate isomerase